MKKKRIIFVKCIILLLLFIIFLVLNKFVFNRTEEVIETNAQTFKNYTFNLPNGIKFSKNDEYEFKLTSSKWIANIEPYFDDANYILGYSKCTRKRYVDRGYEVGELEVDTEGFENGNYIQFNVTAGKENNIIVYYRYNEDTIFYIDLINNDNSFDKTPIETLLNIIKNIKYNGSEKFDHRTFKVDYYINCNNTEHYYEE